LPSPATFIGVRFIFVNGASYGEKFPTVTRTMKYAVIDAEISVMEASGADPLPEGLVGSREKFRPTF